MFNTLDEMMNYLHTRESKLGMDFGLGRMNKILASLDNPEKKFRSIHIAGSNGKGSTLNVIKHILMKSGLKVGTFTSPHLEKVNERMMINDTMIDDESLLELMNEAAPFIEEYGATYFEILTILSFMYYAKSDVDLAIIETGLGGRLDSTNVITPLLSIITSISLEHTTILGDTLAQIASEKAGIIKNGVPVVSGVREQEAHTAIQLKADKQASPLYVLDRDIIISGGSIQKETQSFSLAFGKLMLDDLVQPMFGRHQMENAALGVTAIQLLNEYYGYGITEASIREGLRASKWNGRFEVLAPNLVIDGAHNPAGIKVLLETLKERYPDKRYRFVFTVLQDKKFTAMLQMIDEAASGIILTSIENDRAASASELMKVSNAAERIAFADWKEAADAALRMVKEDEILIFAGSLYFIALIRPYLLKMNGPTSR